MDPPLSDDEEEESLYSSSFTSNTNQQDPQENNNNTLSQASSSSPPPLSQQQQQQPHQRDGASSLNNSINTEHNQTLQSSSTNVSRSPSSAYYQSNRSVSAGREDEKINDEDIKVKIPLSTSIMLTKLDHDTSDIIKKLSTPRVKKLTIRFQPIGSMEQIQPKIFKISSSQQFQTLVKFLNKKLSKKIQVKTTNKLFGGCVFCYLNNSFTPGPEEVIGNLFEHFAINNELTVSYCDKVAFR